MIKTVVELKIQKVIDGFGMSQKVHLEHPANEDFGDYSTNVAMHTAKELKEDPFVIAQKLAASIPVDDTIQKVQVVKPGFINIWLTKEVLFKEGLRVARNELSFEKNNKKEAVVEYSSPNIAKPFTVGHLRSTVIGSAVANLLEATGWKVYRDNHVGDWGTQFGKQIYAVKMWGNEEEIARAKNPVKLLVELYVKFHEEAEKNPSLEEEGRRWFKELENGDIEARKLWQKCIDWSWKEFQQIYTELGVTFTENNGRGYGESFFEDKMQPVIKELKEKKLLTESEGAELVFFPDDKYPPLMIMKDDGATLYSTRDLATDKFRLEHYGKDIKVINEVGAEQSLYFKQLYEIEEMLGWYKKGQRIHIGHGMYRFKDKKMSTRKGNVIWLEDVLNEAVDRARDIATKQEEDVTKYVAMGAIKWNDLKRSSQQDIVFDWDDILNMQGNSGPYMQYAYVRAMSILKDQNVNIDFSTHNSLEPEELNLLRSFYRYEEVIEQAAESFSPHIVTTYLFDLAQKFNFFYQQHPILKADEKTKQFRLLLTQSTAQIIKNGLHLLGIETVENM